MSSKKKASVKKTTPSNKKTSVKRTVPAAPQELRRPEFDYVLFARTVHMLNASGFETIAEAIVFCEALLPDQTLAAVHKKTGMPFSSLSRIAWGLTQAPRRLLSYIEHPTDRRKKILRANVEALKGASNG